MLKNIATRHPAAVSLMALTATVLAMPAVAQDDAADERIEPIDVVTIIGRKIDPNDVPGSAHVVDADALAALNTSDILRVLRTVPGVYIQEEEGFGLRPNIGIRGSGIDRSSRIALLEDGILIAPAPYAASSAYYFPTQRRMSAVEVLKGPSAVAVGPRTTGGAVNLISTPVPDDFSASLDVRAGEFGSSDTHVYVGNGNRRVRWLVETVQAESDGFKTIDGPVGGDTGFDIEDYVGKLWIESDPQSAVYQSLRLKAGYTEQDSDETYLGLTDADFAADPYRRYAASANDNFTSRHEQLQATYVVDADSGWRATVTAYNNDFRRNWYKLQSVGGESLSDVLEDPATFAAEYGYLTGSTSPDDALQIRANNREYYSRGVQGSVDWDLGFGDADVLLTTGFRVHEDEEDRFQDQDGYRMENGRLVLTTDAAGGSQTNRVSGAEATSLFVDAEIAAGDWIFTPGLRYEDIELERLDYSTADPDRSNGPTRVRTNSTSVVIPGFGALYRVNENWRLLAGIHEGYNPPAPGSSADAETSLNIELGTRYTADGLNLEAIWFMNDYDNLVGTVTESTGGGGAIGDQFDGGEAIVSGLELSMNSAFDVRTFTIPVELRYTWTGEAEFENGFESDFDPWGDVVPGDELPYIPEHQLRAAIGVENEKFRVNLGMSYVDRVRTVAGQGTFPAGETIPSYTVWDVMATWRFTPQLASYLKVDNLFDEEYAAARRPAGLRPGLPQAAYIGFRYSL